MKHRQLHSPVPIGTPVSNNGKCSFTDHNIAANRSRILKTHGGKAPKCQLDLKSEVP